MKADNEALFAPPTEDWQRLSPKYLTVKLISIAFWWPVLFAGPLVGLWFATADGMRVLFWVGLAAALMVWAWRLIRAPRVFRRWGYAERGEDVYVTEGLFRRSLTCVPYGRMQLVEVQAGPIDRMFGLASVSMTTAAVGGSITIPGLDRKAAEELRDRFISRGEHLKAGV